MYRFFEKSSKVVHETFLKNKGFVLPLLGISSGIYLSEREFSQQERRMKQLENDVLKLKKELNYELSHKSP